MLTIYNRTFLKNRAIIFSKANLLIFLIFGKSCFIFPMCIDLALAKSQSKSVSNLIFEKIANLCSTGDTKQIKYLIEKYNLDPKRCLVSFSVGDTYGSALPGLDYGFYKENFRENRSTLLHISSGYGSLETVKYLVSLGLDPKSLDSRKTLSIHYAAACGKLEIVKYFLEETDITQDFEQASGLEFGVNNLYIPRNNSRERIKENWYLYLLYFALENNNPDLIAYILDRLPNFNTPNFNTNEKRYTELIYKAAYYGNISFFKYLFEVRGLNNFNYNRCGYNLLHAAFASKNKDLIKYLIMKEIPIRYGSKIIYPELFKFAQDVKGKILIDLIRRPTNKSKIIDHIRSSSINLDAQDLLSCTALHWAVITDAQDYVKELLLNGASVDAQGLCGIRPIDLAAYLNRIEIYELLIEFGAKVDLCDRFKFNVCLENCDFK